MTADIYIDDKKKGVFFYFVELNATLVKENPFLRSSIFFWRVNDTGYRGLPCIE